MKKQIKRLKKENKKLNDKLNYANATVHGLMEESAMFRIENIELREVNKTLISYGVSKIEDLSEVYEGHMEIAEGEIKRLNVILNYLEMKDLT